MKNLISSIVLAVLRRAPRRSLLSIAGAFALAVAGLASGVSAEPDNAEARALFAKFVAAQNAHDLSAVKSMLWNSPDMLFFSRGTEARGAEAAADRFKEYYQGTWHLEPDMSGFHAAAITPDVMQILVPIVFTRGLPGATPQSNTFLISQTFVRDAQGWHIASILPVANTQLK
ncbi:MAG TPA: DUF4440 domain-containing protein [Bradyrhizobium sp.]|nr:DUF4440 domain-containing protein [Bradyrhizobium sp.]